MTTRPLLLLGALAASACIQQPESADATLAKYRGQPASSVIARLGPPDRQEAGPGNTTYVWNTRYRPDRGASPSAMPTYATGQPSTTAPPPQQMQDSVCTFRVLADGAGIVTAATTTGDNVACAPVYKKLAGW